MSTAVAVQTNDLQFSDPDQIIRAVQDLVEDHDFDGLDRLARSAKIAELFFKSEKQQEAQTAAENARIITEAGIGFLDLLEDPFLRQDLEIGDRLIKTPLRREWRHYAACAQRGNLQDVLSQFDTDDDDIGFFYRLRKLGYSYVPAGAFEALLDQHGISVSIARDKAVARGATRPSLHTNLGRYYWAFVFTTCIDLGIDPLSLPSAPEPDRSKEADRAAQRAREARIALQERETKEKEDRERRARRALAKQVGGKPDKAYSELRSLMKTISDCLEEDDIDRADFEDMYEWLTRTEDALVAALRRKRGDGEITRKSVLSEKEQIKMHGHVLSEKEQQEWNASLLSEVRRGQTP